MHVVRTQMSKFQGEGEQSLRAEVLLIANTRAETAKPWSRPPISMQFTVRPQLPSYGL